MAYANPHRQGNNAGRALLETPEFLKKERQEKGIRIGGLPRTYNNIILREYLKKFGDVVERVEPMNHKELFALYRFREKESVDKIKAEKSHHLLLPAEFGKIFITGWFNRDKKRIEVPPPKPPRGNHCPIETFDANIPFEDQVYYLLRKLTPGEDFQQKYNNLCGDVRAAVAFKFRDCKVQPFGSTLTGLAFKQSDVDIFVETRAPKNLTADRKIKIIKEQIFRHSTWFHQPVFIRAKTPIIRCIHTGTGLKCDISSQNALGVRNSLLIKYFVDLDPRIRPFLLVIKYWAKYFDLSGTSQMISNYALICTALFYLQQLDNPLIPTVAYLQSLCNQELFIDGWRSNFCPTRWLASAATVNMTVYDMLSGYFDYYSKFDYAKYVISPLVGKLVEKRIFTDEQPLPVEMRAFTENGNPDEVMKFCNGESICVQDPFVLNHNIAKQLGPYYMENIMLPNYTRAAQTFREVVNQQLLLTVLFSEKNRVIPALPTSMPRLLEVKLLPESVIGLSPTELANGSIDAWFNDSYSFVMYMLKELLNLDVRTGTDADVDSDEESPSKRQKLNVETDASVATGAASPAVTLHCSGCFDVMDMRSVVRKEVLAGPPMTPLKRELLITETVVAKVKLRDSATGTINFSCKLIPNVEPNAYIKLEIKNEGSSGKKFKKWTSFMSDQLSKWYSAFFLDYRHNVLRAATAFSEENGGPSTSRVVAP